MLAVYNVLMASTVPTFNDLYPAVIVASSNNGLRRQIMERFTGCRVAAAEAIGGADALGKLENSECQLLLLDRRLPDLNSDELVHMIHQRFPGIDVLLFDEDGSPALPSEWRSEGACRLWETIDRWQAPAAQPIKAAAPIQPLPGMVGHASSMSAVYRMARLVAPRRTPVLITGATGTGKELVATAIHHLSPRSAKPFVVINCAAIPEDLLESELFGYVRGAFTGAVQSRLGRIHSAHGGTLFLDEVGELPLGMQSKLLRFLQEGEVQRLGSPDIVRVDVRVIAATNADLTHLISENRFREDLYYRLTVFPIVVSPLRERPEDIPALSQHFLQLFCQESGVPLKRLTPAALRMLEKHAWPGNIRELRHTIERAFILSADQAEILPEHISLQVRL